MHAFANWVSWQGTPGLLTALIEHYCSIRVSRSFCSLGGRAQQTFGRAWALPGPMPLPTPLDPPLNLFLFVRCSYKGNWPKADIN